MPRRPARTMNPRIAFSSACATRAPTRQPDTSAPESSGRNQASRGLGSEERSMTDKENVLRKYPESSARLKDTDYCNERGEPFNPQSVRAMIEGPQPRPPRRL